MLLTLISLLLIFYQSTTYPTLQGRITLYNSLHLLHYTTQLLALPPFSYYTSTPSPYSTYSHPSLSLQYSSASPYSTHFLSPRLTYLTILLSYTSSYSTHSLSPARLTHPNWTTTSLTRMMMMMVKKILGL